MWNLLVYVVCSCNPMLRLLCCCCCCWWWWCSPPGKLFFKDWSSVNEDQRMANWDKKFKLLLSYPQVINIRATPGPCYLPHIAHSILSLVIGVSKRGALRSQPCHLNRSQRSGRCPTAIGCAWPGTDHNPPPRVPTCFAMSANIASECPKQL